MSEARRAFTMDRERKPVEKALVVTGSEQIGQAGNTPEGQAWSIDHHRLSADNRTPLKHEGRGNAPEDFGRINIDPKPPPIPSAKLQRAVSLEQRMQLDTSRLSARPREPAVWIRPALSRTLSTRSIHAPGPRASGQRRYDTPDPGRNAACERWRRLASMLAHQRSPARSVSTAR